MRNLLYILLLAPLLAFTQVPQGVGYQGVATDAAGFELINQSISIRASVISNSATGTIEWQETHNTSTDTFGLFNLTIGQGTSTGNGTQTSFADITWGANTHFLKIEMDVNGGTNYSHMGTNQMMSVPYALYAENANIDYDSISTILSNDSTFITTVGGGMGGGGCDFQFPDGYDGEFLTHDLSNNNSYSVPAGKNLYVTNIYVNSTWPVEINGISITSAYINSSTGNSGTMGNTLSNPLLLKSGDIINSGASGASFNGYLVDENYFIDCGSGGGTSSSGGGSNSGNGSGCDVIYPDGLVGESFLFELVHDNQPWSIPVSYTVPANKNLYITSFMAYYQSTELKINSSTIFKGYGNYNITGDNNGHFSLPIICSSGDVLSVAGAECRISGILVDKNVDPISINGNFTVPNGKRLVVLNYFSDNWSGFSVDGIAVIYGYYNLYTQGSMSSPPEARLSLKIPLIFDGGSILVIDTTDLLNGYLVDENYFADCGGGGSSGSGGGNNNSGNMIVSDFGDTLTLNGQSIIVPGISYSNYVPSYGSVTDIDGNTYQTTTIYGKEWMIEDLLVTKYSNGDPITLITGVNPWWGSVCSNAGYRTHSNVGSLGPKVWYNIYVVQDSRGICPNGWHIPTEQDYIDILNIFDVMTSTGNGYGSWWENAGPPLKKLTGGWDYTNYPEGQATNQSYLGFESFGPATCTNNSYSGSNTEHRSWTSTPGGPNGGNWSLYLKPQEDQVYFDDASADTMLPCRCVKD
jgi:uncharacterized protein (TIGR02145 family)